MSHVLVEVLNGVQERETSFDAPAIETVNARMEMLGIFRDDSIGANQAATAMTVQAIDATAPTHVMAAVGGTIIGLSVEAVSTTTHGAISAGTMTCRATVGGVAVGNTATLTASIESATVIFSPPIAYASQALLGVTLASASLAPTSSLARVYLLVRHEPACPANASGGAGLP